MNPKNRWPSRPQSLRDWQLARLRPASRDAALPLSAHHRRLFAAQHLDAAQLRTMDDLRRIPFTTKSDFLPGSDGSDPVRDFVLVPDKAVLARRFTTILKALTRGRVGAAEDFQREFRPLLLT